MAFTYGIDLMEPETDMLPLDTVGHGSIVATQQPYAAARNAADAGLGEDAAAWAVAFVAGWQDYDTVNVYATARQLGTSAHQQQLDDYTDVAGNGLVDPNLAAGVPHYPKPSADLLAFDQELDLMQDDLPGAP